MPVKLTRLPSLANLVQLELLMAQECQVIPLVLIVGTPCVSAVGDIFASLPLGPLHCNIPLLLSQSCHLGHTDPSNNWAKLI